MKPVFKILMSEGEEGLHEFFVNGVEVGSCDHDTAGWQGMADQKDMFKAIAKELGVEVIESFDDTPGWQA
jgi:hypothetical protein